MGFGGTLRALYTVHILSLLLDKQIPGRYDRTIWLDLKLAHIVRCTKLLDGRDQPRTSLARRIFYLTLKDLNLGPVRIRLLHSGHFSTW